MLTRLRLTWTAIRPVGFRLAYLYTWIICRFGTRANGKDYASRGSGGVISKHHIIKPS